MAYAMNYIQPSAQSTVLFQAWGSGVSAMLAAAGLVKTSDTGQIVWTTVANPAVVQTVAGFEIWRFNDSLQATAPIFIKVEYGNGNSTSTPSVWLTVGTGTDGAGAITGVMVTRRQSAMGTFSTGAFPCHAVGDASSFLFSSCSGISTNYAIMFGVERSRNASGVPTAEGIFFFVTNSNSGYIIFWEIVPYGLLDTTYGTVWSGSAPIILPSSVSGGSLTASTSVSKDGVTTPALLVPLFGVGVTPWTSQLIAVILPGDIGSGGLAQLTVNGSVHTYRAISNSFGFGGIIPYSSASNPPTIYPVILWE